MSVASTRRSTFRLGTWVSSKSTTPLPRTSIYLSSKEHQAAASTRQQAQFQLCWNQVHQGLASGNCRRTTILLQVGPAARNLVRTWNVKQLFQVFSVLCQRWREIETKTLCKHWETGTISTKSLNGKLNWPCEEKNWLSKDYTKPRQMWRWSLLFMRSVRSSSPNDYSNNRRINGLIRLKETK